MKVMLLAAGEGTRFRPHTLKLPKPAIPLLNVPLAFYSLEVLNEFGALDLVANTYHLPEKIVGTLEYARSHLKSLNFSHEKKLLGSGGGLWQAKKYFENQDTFILMNADEVILPLQVGQLQKAYEYHLRNNALSTLIVMDHAEVGSKFGAVWMGERQKVIGFGKTKPSTATHGFHFIGIQFLSKRIFQYLPDGESNILLNGVMNGIKVGEKVQVFKLDTDWFETGNLQDYLQATEKCLHLLVNRKSSVLASVMKKFASTCELEKSTAGIFLIDKTALVKKSQLSGFAVIGAHAKIDAGIKIKNSVIGADLGVEVNKDLINELIL